MSIKCVTAAPVNKNGCSVDRCWNPACPPGSFWFSYVVNEQPCQGMGRDCIRLLEAGFDLVWFNFLSPQALVPVPLTYMTHSFVEWDGGEGNFQPRRPRERIQTGISNAPLLLEHRASHCPCCRLWRWQPEPCSRAKGRVNVLQPLCGGVAFGRCFLRQSSCSTF